MAFVAERLLELSNHSSIYCFEGEVGAGKTTLIKLMAEALDIQDHVQSPTFGYVNTYENKVYHFDCYRFETPIQALDMGFEEYIDSDKMIWIEWPQMIYSLLDIPYIQVKISHTQSQSRNIEIHLV
ncbi:MAG: tRNA (adenosine(37)-N6)-threonylcarbamoyltransferase complex ATPase subunit type 1 TsaE [Leadbetterella sp.]